MANEKIWNKALLRAKKKVREYCIDYSVPENLKGALLSVIEKEMRQYQTQGVPDPNDTPPGHGTGKP